MFINRTPKYEVAKVLDYRRYGRGFKYLVR
jgi:hypothetical protein